VVPDRAGVVIPEPNRVGIRGQSAKLLQQIRNTHNAVTLALITTSLEVCKRVSCFFAVQDKGRVFIEDRDRIAAMHLGSRK
jgi:ABC-type methionine transport system ATPase subunit